MPDEITSTRCKGDDNVARLEVACSANYEVSVLAGTLAKLIADADPGSELAIAARGMLRRIQNLSDLVFEVMFRNDESPDDLRTARELRIDLGEEVRHG